LFAKKDSMMATSVLLEMSQDPFIRLDNVYQEFKCFRLLFDLYSRQTDARNVWAETLWSELNPQLLLEGMDSFLKEFKRFPKQCRSLKAGLALENDMKTFKNSISLFTELKNEAMSEMHWQKLMDQTGKFPIRKNQTI
jgi:dynein heavy chain